MIFTIISFRFYAPDTTIHVFGIIYTQLDIKKDGR